MKLYVCIQDYTYGVPPWDDERAWVRGAVAAFDETVTPGPEYWELLRIVSMGHTGTFVTTAEERKLDEK